MRRRAFIILFGGAVASLYSADCSAQSQPSRVYRLGLLPAARNPLAIEALQDGLRRLGYIEGQNLKTEYRFREGGVATLDELAVELVRLEPDIIVTIGTPAVIAAKRATTTIPIVMANAGDPLAFGIIASLAHPGGNITGLTLYASELASKRLEVFKEAVPGITGVAVLGNARNPLSQRLWQETEEAARPLALETRLFTVQDAADLPAVFEAIARDGDGVVVLPDNMFASARRMIATLAADHRLAAMYDDRAYTQEGGLISYGPNVTEITRRSAAYVDKIFKGAKPADLPVEQPTDFEMVINLRTAKALGLTIPLKLLIVADEVIE
jgi:putative tryptophan/tyrosine transport system substrate-binding protein